MDKEKLRELFGKLGDVNKALGKMFGSAYLDHPDDSQEVIPELKQLAQTQEVQIAKVDSLVGRAVESSPDISCEENQTILLRFLKGYMSENVESTFEEISSTTKHKQSCPNQKCGRVDFIATLDNRLTPSQMKASFGEEIESWEIG